MTLKNFEMETPKTLSEAREQLEAANAQLSDLSKKLAAYENEELLTAAGILQIKNEDTGEIHFESKVLKDFQAQVVAYEAKITALEAEKATLSKAGEDMAVNLLGANKRITELESNNKTAEARAREIVGNMGGAPLAVDASQSLTSLEELRSSLASEKDHAKRSELFNRINAMKKNGAQK